MIDFVDPKDRTSPLRISGEALVSPSGTRYAMVDGVPNFTAVADAGQAQTSTSFGFKWNKQPDWGFKPGHTEVVWSIWKDFFGWDGPAELERLMRGKVVLDAGCGAGTALNQFVDYPAALAAVDISEAIHACHARFGSRPNIQFAQADLTELPFRDGAFDVIWSAGVLHHTPDTFQSLKALRRHLKPGGRMIVYVYVKKAPLREYADDYVREQIAHLAPDEAWRHMAALTSFARSLSAIKGDLVIDEDVPELGFRKGTYNVQRFVYYNLFKCFWNDALSFEDNVHVNFDWYHPRYSHRHSPDEVRGWLDTLSLESERFHVSDSGISVIARGIA
ncbi:MAG TPA: class I SAM-dependent methyltransferase [Vicinamibacterales bacterium]|nr:class I SAM-dependent methyltransferase [Vicinamibacterales bacterium]